MVLTIGPLVGEAGLLKEAARGALIAPSVHQPCSADERRSLRASCLAWAMFRHVTRASGGVWLIRPSEVKRVATRVKTSEAGQLRANAGRRRCRACSDVSCSLPIQENARDDDPDQRDQEREEVSERNEQQHTEGDCHPAHPTRQGRGEDCRSRAEHHDTERAVPCDPTVAVEHVERLRSITCHALINSIREREVNQRGSEQHRRLDHGALVFFFKQKTAYEVAT